MKRYAFHQYAIFQEPPEGGMGLTFIKNRNIYSFIGIPHLFVVVRFPSSITFFANIEVFHIVIVVAQVNDV